MRFQTLKIKSDKNYWDRAWLNIMGIKKPEQP